MVAVGTVDTVEVGMAGISGREDSAGLVHIIRLIQVMGSEAPVMGLVTIDLDRGLEMASEAMGTDLDTDLGTATRMLSRFTRHTISHCIRTAFSLPRPTR
jgi:hypothetical protein